MRWYQVAGAASSRQQSIDVDLLCDKINRNQIRNRININKEPSKSKFFGKNGKFPRVPMTGFQELGLYGGIFPTV
jgi:hypothetical protein